MNKQQKIKLKGNTKTGLSCFEVNNGKSFLEEKARCSEEAWGKPAGITPIDDDFDAITWFYLDLHLLRNQGKENLTHSSPTVKETRCQAISISWSMTLDKSVSISLPQQRLLERDDFQGILML